MPVIPDQTANDIEDIETDALDVIDETQDAVINYVRERPLTALLATFALGFVVGRFVPLTLRKKHSKAAMQTTAGHPGVEMDSKGHPIAMAKRLPEDRQKVRRKAKAIKRNAK